MPRVVRLLTGAAVAALAIAALRLPAPAPGRPGDLLERAPDLSRFAERDTLGFGETLTKLLMRRGLSGRDAANVIAAAPLDPRRIPAGLEVEVVGDTIDRTPDEVRFHMDVDHVVRVLRGDSAWTVTEERLPWSVDTLIMRGRVTSSLYAAVEEGAQELLPARARQELAWNIADIYEYRFDMSRDLQNGDEVRVLFERRRAPNGAVRIGTVLAAGLQRAGSEVQAIRMPVDNGRSKYYDQQGRSLASTFLRTPVSFRRISSNFGRRKHPVLGTWRQHQGMDYAADAGTPVRTIGDGVVIFAGQKGGYGNAIEVRHPNGFVTRYGHLRAFASGVRSGSRITIGSTIGYVGMTGLATGPHLHFEVLVNGVQRDPRGALTQSSGPPLTGADLALFERIRSAAVFALEQPAGVVRPPAN
ncbi:MAG: M23 family metallopeptidase [Gemmatimonadales bacterium]|nr:M23 family metallopeptidase [Gemmatimonadota bacterium]MCL4212845.1 M23 family metallopeptidase [Gemmatimonadales bacterium]